MTSAALTVTQAAGVWGVSPRTVRRYCKAGHIPAEQAAGQRGGRSGNVYTIPAALLHLHSTEDRQSSSSPTPEPINLSTFLARGGNEAVLRAADRLELIQSARKITGSNRTEQLRQLAAQAGIGLSTLYRWMQKGQSLEGAATTYRRKFDENGQRIRNSIEPEARDWFLSQWNAQNKLPVPAVIEHLYKPKAQEMGWKIPSRATFYRLVAEDLTAVERKAGREGIKALRGQTLPKNTLRFPEQRNLVWVSDHRQMDFFVVNPATGEVARPWITAIMDVASRALVGHTMSFNPNSDAILKALTMAVYADAPFEPALPVWFLEDNGQDYRSKVVTGTLDALGIKQRQCEVEHAWQKGTIESWFKLVGYRFDRFFGWTGHNVLARPELHDEKRMAAEGKVYSFEEFEACFAQFVSWYHNEHQHTGDGMNGNTPAHRYSELPSARIGVPSAKVMPLLMLREERRKVGDQGIRIWNRFMWHDGLYRHDNPISRSVVDEWVTLRFDPQDKSRVYVFYEGQFVCVATDKPRPTFDPENEENMEIAGRVRTLSKKLEADTMERLHQRAGRAGSNPWIPAAAGQDNREAPAQDEPVRMVTKMDRVAKQIEKQQQKDTAKRPRDESVSKRIRDLGSKYA